MYDYLIVGAGLFGSVFAHEATASGRSCLVIDRRGHIGGNLYCENIEGIRVHKYGAHIFHTNDKAIWDYIGQFAEFNRYTNAPIANFKGEIYNLPFNMNTFHQLWGVKTPEEAKRIIARQRGAADNPPPFAPLSGSFPLETSHVADEPGNLEEQAISLVGTDIYEKLIKGYTEKQWGRKASELPAFIIRRLPVRFTFDNSYFDDTYQGIPVGGYNQIIERLIDGADIQLNADYLSRRESYNGIAKKILYTGMIDEFFGYCYGALEYRSLSFETEVLDTPNYQGNAVVNYTSGAVPYTRIIEHKHFEFGTQEKTVITREYPEEWRPGGEPYYPVNDERNNRLCERYRALAEKEENVMFGGRLGSYRYYDMWQVVREALIFAKKEIGR